MRSLKKRVAVIAMVLAAPLLLSGCIRTNADIRVGQDGNIGEASILIGVRKDAVKAYNIANLSQFEEYVSRQYPQDGNDHCAFHETGTEYVANCVTSDVVDSSGLFRGVTTAVKGSDLVMTISEGAFTGDILSYNLAKESAGSITFYFDGNIQSVSAPTGNYRLPNDSVIIFDLVNGKFFNENVVIVVTPQLWVQAIPFALIAAVLLGVATIIMLVRKAKTPRNPFLDYQHLGTGTADPLLGPAHLHGLDTPSDSPDDTDAPESPSDKET